MYPRRYRQGAAFLRSSERLARLEVDRVLQLATMDADIHSVLDVGTGSGVFAEAFAKSGFSVEGIDANPEMIAEAEKALPGVHFSIGIAESLPFKDQTFDLVFMGLLLHETNDRLKAIQEGARVARKGMAILEWPYQVQDFGPSLEVRLQEEQIMQMATQAGFQKVEVFPLHALVLFCLS